MYRICIFLIIVFLFSINSFSKQRQYIYVFDCTQSMDKDYGIWESAKQWLKEDIERKRDNALITIVPFRDGNDGIMGPFLKSQVNWSSLENKFNTLISSAHSRTGICRAWKSATPLMKPEYENWFILLTDGGDGYDGSAKVKELMRSWCQFHEGCHGYVVTLSKVAKDALWTDLSNCDDIDIIDCASHIPVIGSFIKKPMSMLASSPKNFVIGFSEEGEYKGHVKCNDPYYDVSLESNTISNESAKIIVKEKIRPTQNHEIQFRIISDQAGVKFLKPSFSIYVDTRDLKNVNFAVNSGGEYNGGKDDTYDSFLGYPSKDWACYSIKLENVLNKQAISSNASMKMSVDIPSVLENKIKIFLGDEEIGNSFVLDSLHNKSSLLIKVSHDAPEDVFSINITGIGTNIESVNGELTNTYGAKLLVKHTVSWNPLKISLFCLFCVFLIICLIKIFYSHLRRGVCCGIDFINNGNQEVLVKKRKANRIVISPKAKKQHWIDWLFNGKTLYNIEPIPELKSDICFKAARLKRTMRLKCQENKNYSLDGFKMRKQILTANEEIKHVITDKNNIELLTLIIF